MKPSPHDRNPYSVLKIVGIYILFGSLWIYFSDTVLGWLTHDPVLMMRIAVLKGLLFIAVTALLLYTLIRRSEEALRTSELQLLEAMDLAHIVYWEFDLVAQTFVFNDPFYAFYGTTAEREGGYLVSREDYAKRFIHPDDLQLVRRFMEQNTTMTGAEFSSDLEHRIIRRDGEVRHILARTRVFKDDSGRIVRRYGANQDITDRKEMAKALEESGEQFEKLFMESPLGMVIVGADFLFIRANAAFCGMLGYTEKELTSLTFKDVTYPDQIAKDIVALNDLISGNATLYQTEKQYIRKDKGVVWGSLIVNAIRDKDNRFLHFFTTVEDITSRKRADEAIKRTAAEWRTTFDSIEDMIMIIDLDWRIVRVNKSVVSFLGLSYSDILGKYCYDLMHWGKQSSEEWCFSKMLNSKKHEESVMYIDEKGTWMSTSVDPIFDGKGNITGAVHIMKDVTERKQLEEALRESESKFRDLVEKSIVGVFLIQDQVFKYVNARFAEIHGYTVDEVIVKKTARDLVLPEDIQKLNDDSQRLASGKFESFKNEHRIVTKEQEIRNVAVYGAYTIYQGKPAIIGTILDITEQKRDEETLMDLFSDLEKKNVELENTYDELRESQQKIIQQEKMASIGQLAAGIAHEINNPVGFVMSNLHSMGKYSERLSQFIEIQSETIEKLSIGAEDVAAVLDGLHKKRQTLKIDYVTNDLTNVIKESLEGTERVKCIVQDLKSFSHKDESVHKLADINDGMESAINVVWNELKYKADVKKEYGKIPLTKCNIGQLNQVFMNLLVNAVHAIEEHGEILIRTEHRDGDIVVSVSDTGCGIPEDKLNMIFEPFYTTKKIGEGTGLGLSIAYDIVKKHNGGILVTSEIGKGTTFTVTIPVVED